MLFRVKQDSVTGYCRDDSKKPSLGEMKEH
jgi:hypothetical protein